jgi:osmoprotectant transport system permease protein
VASDMASDVASDVASPATAEPTTDEDALEPAARPGRLRSMPRGTVLMLVVPPVLVVGVFLVYVWWRQTATLDSTELSQLAWPTVWRLLWEHVQLTVVSALAVVVIAVPAGVALTRGPLRAAAPAIVGVANAGQAAPSIGLIALFAMWLGYGFVTAVIALTLYGLLPVLRNTITGLQGVDPTLKEAGRGVGMSATAVLLRIELPLAGPVIMAGVRTALVLLVGTAALATFIDAGGLGAIIVTGISLLKVSLMVWGAILIALLALLVEWVGRVLELVTRPKGI